MTDIRLDEVFDTQFDVERNPCGAWQAIQTLQAALDRAEADTAAAVEAMLEVCLAIVGPMASSNSLYAANAGQAAYSAIRALSAPKLAQIPYNSAKKPEITLINQGG